MSVCVQPRSLGVVTCTAGLVCCTMWLWCVVVLGWVVCLCEVSVLRSLIGSGESAPSVMKQSAKKI